MIKTGCVAVSFIFAIISVAVPGSVGTQSKVNYGLFKTTMDSTSVDGLATSKPSCGAGAAAAAFGIIAILVSTVLLAYHIMELLGKSDVVGKVVRFVKFVHLGSAVVFLLTGICFAIAGSSGGNCEPSGGTPGFGIFLFIIGFVLMLVAGFFQHQDPATGAYDEIAHQERVHIVPAP